MNRCGLAICLGLSVIIGGCAPKPVASPVATPSWLADSIMWQPEGQDFRAENEAERRIYNVNFGGMAGVDSVWIWRTENGRVMRSEAKIGEWQRTMWLSVDSLFQPGIGGERWRKKQTECVTQWRSHGDTLKSISYTRGAGEATGPSRSFLFALPDKIFLDVASPVAAEWGVMISIPLMEPTSFLRIGGCPGWDSVEIRNGIFPALLRVVPGDNILDPAKEFVLTRWRLADETASAPDTISWQRGEGRVNRFVTFSQGIIDGVWRWEQLLLGAEK